MSKSHKKKNCQFFWSLLQGVKRACEDAGDNFIVQTMEKHAKLLQRDHPIDEHLEKRYREAFQEFFEGFEPNFEDIYEMSNSASWEYRRSDGGARAYLLDKANDVRINGTFASLERSIAQGICSVLYSIVEVRPGVTKELRGVRTPSLCELYHIAEANNKDFAPNCAMVAAILEPLKVRLITKGPAASYYMAKSFQKDLLKYLQRFPQFELTGDTLREDHLYRMIEREKDSSFEFMEFSHFVSGDYSSATDNLGIQYTMIGLEEALEKGNLPHHWMRSLRRVLWGHEIHYPSKYNLPKVFQTNGQLMGSPLSFPFLCINNLIAYKLSLEDWLGGAANGPLRFHKLPVLVNGDDILFRTNPDHYEIWKQHVHAIGFDLSIGKNYIHKDVLTINSTMFHYTKEKRFHHIPFCNFGLLSGTSKKGGSRGEVRDKAIDLRDAYMGSVGGSSNKPLAHAKFMIRNKESISRITSRGRYNLFVPREVGGLGFPLYEGIQYRVTRFQRLLAKLVLKSVDDKPLFGFKTKVDSNSIVGEESRNKKFYMVGMGPLEEGVREPEQPLFCAQNSSYLHESETKWFTKIPQKYDAEKLFPFRLKETDSVDHEGLRVYQHTLEGPRDRKKICMV